MKHKSTIKVKSLVTSKEEFERELAKLTLEDLIGSQPRTQEETEREIKKACDQVNSVTQILRNNYTNIRPRRLSACVGR